MKQTLLFSAVIGLALALGSCGPAMALFSLHTPEDKIFDEQLLGEWRQVDPEEKKAKSNEAESDESLWSFTRGEDGQSYGVKISSVEAKDKSGFVSTARLVKLDNFLFMDFMGPSEDDRKSGFYPYPVVRAHMIARIHADKKTLRIEFLSDDWIKKQSKAGKPALATLDADGQFLVTATTAELRKFALVHAEDAEAFSDHWEFARAK